MKYADRYRKLWPVLLMVLLLGVPERAFAQAPTLWTGETVKREAFIDSLLAEMTVEEKLGQLAQYTGQWAETGPTMPQGGEEEVRAGRVGSFLNIFGADVTRETQRIAVESSRLGIPLLFGHDVIHGFRTIFPVPLAEASSWDPVVVEEAARVAAEEATAHGIHWTFAPMVDIARDPRWGRIVEGSGEDPYLGSVMAAARVRGFQGTDLNAPNTMLACAKHFAAYGGAEGGRDYNTVDISERTLREIYLKPFHAAVDAGVATLMSSFNEISGIPSHANPFLTKTVLRDEWGFEGFVVGDYTGVLELLQHGIGATRAEVGKKALEAGVDMDMVSGIYANDLPALVNDGQLDIGVVDEAVRRVLRAKYALGLFDDPYRYSDPSRQAAFTLTPDQRAVARKMAQESIVLLKNDGGVLPLSKGIETLAVIGALADDARSSLGSWAAAGRPEDVVTILTGIREAVGSNTEVVYARGAGPLDDDASGIPEAVRAAEGADAVVLVVGEDAGMSGEASNRSSLDLPGAQQQLAEAIYATGKPVVAVLMNGRPLSVTWLDEHVPSILETWYLGVEMGHAVADVLFGDVNPSGKLPVTFPRNVGQVPIYYNHKNTGRPPDASNHYTSKYLDVPWTPLYVFGHGLSYTTFDYANLQVNPQTIHPAGSVTVQVEVTNTGEREGVEVVQLYLRDEVASVTRPVKELRRFERVALAPGETKTVTFTLGPDDLSFLDVHLEPVVEPGFFTVYVGTSSAAELSGRFEVVE